jgi:hypothetical protein
MYMKITKNYERIVSLLDATSIVMEAKQETTLVALFKEISREFETLMKLENAEKTAKSKPAKQVKAPAKPKVSVSDSVKVIVRSAELDNEVIVATLTNLKDWGTKRKREAGSVENLTAKQLNNVINTWVKHRKDEVLRATKIDGFKADLRKGLSIHTLSQNFVIAPTEKILEVSI